MQLVFTTELYEVEEPRFKSLNLSSQWLIAQLVERSLSAMKDPGSNFGMDIFSFPY
jgi:hypothetical protein